MSYPNINFKWSSTAGAKRYEASIEVMFTERIWVDAAHTQLASETERVLRWDLGEEQADDDEGGQEIKLPTNGEAFFQFLASRLEEDPFITRELGTWNDNIDRVRAFNFVLSIANAELDTYLAGQRPRHRRHSGAPGLHQHLRWLGAFCQQDPAIGRWLGHFQAFGPRAGGRTTHRSVAVLPPARNGRGCGRICLSLSPVQQ